MSDSRGQKHFTLATAGHVDHGKTSLLKALTGIDPDRLKEEKERGMTTDLGFAHLEFPDNIIVGFIDVPGHGKFLKNMLSGVGGIELALLVVAVNEGLMPQTYEHVRILGLLGVKAALVAITKIDLSDAERVKLVEQQVRELLAQERIEVVSVVPVSAVKGTGIEDLKTALLDALKKLPDRAGAGAAFLPIDRVFSKTGFGTVVTGTLVRGRLSPGDQVWIEPAGMSARVRRLETFGLCRQQAEAGQRLACNLVIKDNVSIVRGHVLSGERLNPATLFVVHLIGLPEHWNGAEADSQPIRLYHGTAECHGRVRWIKPIAENDRHNKGKGQEALAAFKLSDPLVAQVQDRFVIRLSNDAIYGGTILLRDQPRRLTRASTADISALLLKGDFPGALLSYVQACPQKMVHKSHLDRLLPAALQKAAIDELIGKGKLVLLGDFLLAGEFHEQLKQNILAAAHKYIEERDSEHLQALVPLEHLRSAVMRVSDRTVFQALVAEMIEQKLLVRQADKLTLPGKEVSSCPPGQEALCAKIESILKSHLCLEIDEIARLTKCPLKEVKAAIEALSRRSRAALVDYQFACSSETIAAAHKILQALWQETKQITPSAFKERLGTTRKYAMALLAYFDDHKITRRTQEGRALLINSPL